ncbi:peptidyl-tRNA hydrolase 2/Bcl-2 inhibitor of transcription 1, partial [Chytriomyces cf. hyalinus JEL632]
HQNPPHKLVLIVNSALKMSQGKIASQCSHATLGTVLNQGSGKSTVRAWLDQGEPIIVVQSGNDSLLDLEKRCLAKGLPVYKIHDAGRTEVASGSLTVLAVGPAPNSEIDVVTRSLSL